MGKITTVCGDISVDKLGLTSMHEHPAMDFGAMHDALKDVPPPVPEWRMEFAVHNMPFIRNNIYRYKEAVCVNNPDLIAHELNVFRLTGGNSVVDCSPCCIRGDVSVLRQASEKTGVNVICATGLGSCAFSANKSGKYNFDNETDALNHLISEIQNGIDGTGIHPGIVKVMVETSDAQGNIDPREDMFFNVAAKAAAESGLPLYVHSMPTLDAEYIISLADRAINKYHVKPDKIVMCHMDGAMLFVNLHDYLTSKVNMVENYYIPEQLMNMGVNIGVDTFGNLINMEVIPVIPGDDWRRIRELVHLINAGYEDHIVLGHDLFPSVEGTNVGLHGFTRITEFAIPMLKKVGISEKSVKKLVIDNPARILQH